MISLRNGVNRFLYNVFFEVRIPRPAESDIRHSETF